MNQFRWLMQKMVDAESHEAGAIFHLHFGPLFWNPLERRFACISVFPVIGMPDWTRFWVILGTVLDRISRVSKTRVSIQPYKNSYPDTLPIQNKNPYLQLFRFFRKSMKPEKWPARTRRCPPCWEQF
jgi:hypothetical protein